MRQPHTIMGSTLPHQRIFTLPTAVRSEQLLPIPKVVGPDPSSKEKGEHVTSCYSECKITISRTGAQSSRLSKEGQAKGTSFRCRGPQKQGRCYHNFPRKKCQEGWRDRTAGRHFPLHDRHAFNSHLHIGSSEPLGVMSKPRARSQLQELLGVVPKPANQPPQKLANLLGSEQWHSEEDICLARR